MKQRGLFRVAKAAPRCLVPVDDRAQVIMAELEPDKKVLVSVHSARYPEQHGFVFMVMQKIADATEHDLRSVMLSLIYETGHFDYIKLLDRSVVPDPESLSPESMSQAEFQKFWDEAKTIIKEKWHELMTVEAYQEIIDMMEKKP